MRYSGVYILENTPTLPGRKYRRWHFREKNVKRERRKGGKGGVFIGKGRNGKITVESKLRDK
jgi:hypothetical protein